MSIGAIDIEFVLKGDVDEKMRTVSSTVKGEGKAIEAQMRRLTGAGTDAFENLSKTAQVQAVALQKVNTQIEQNTQRQQVLKEKMEAGRISSESYTKAIAILAVQKKELQGQAASLGKQLDAEIATNRLVAGSIDEMSDRLSKLKQEYNSLSAAEREGAIGGELQQKMAGLSKELDNAQNSGKGFVDVMRDAPGPIGQTVRGVEGMTRAAMRFIVTPIGAVIAVIVGGLMALSSWFRRTEEGQNALARSSGYFKQVLDSLLDVADSVGEFLYKAFSSPKEALKDLVDFMKGQVVYRFEAIGKMGAAIMKIFSKDWREGLSDMTNATLQFQLGIEDAGNKMANWGSGIVDKAKKRADIEDSLFKIKVEERKLNEEIAAGESKIAELRFKGRDMERPEKERLAALKEAQALIDQNFKKEIELATRRRDLVAQQKGLSNSNLQDNEEVSRLNIEISNLQTRSQDEQRQLMREINTLTKGVAADSIEGVRGMQQELEKLQAKILETEGEQQRKIAERIIELQKELSLRMQVADEALRGARNEADGLNSIPAKMQPGKGVKEAYAEGKKEVRATALEVDKLNKKIKENEKYARELGSGVDSKALDYFRDNTQQILDYSRQFTGELIYQLGLTEQQSDVMNGIADTVFNIASGNWLGAAFSGAGTILAAVKGDGKSDSEKQLERINATLERQSKILATLGNTGETYFSLVTKQAKEYNAEIELNEQKLRKSVTGQYSIFTQKQYEKQYQEDSKAQWDRYYEDRLRQLGDYSYQSMNDARIYADMMARENPIDINKIVEKYAPKFLSPAQFWDIDEIIEQWANDNFKLTDAAVDTIGAITEARKKLNSLLEESWNEVTGSTRNTIADGIIEGFRDGSETGAEIMRTAVVNAFKKKLIEGDLTEWYKGFAEAGMDGYTKEEIDLWQAKYQEMIELQREQWDNIEKVTGVNPNDVDSADPKGLTGAIQALTEETGGMIYGQLMAVRVDIKAILTSMARSDDDTVRSLAYMREIAENTRHNSRLVQIEEGIQETNRLLKQSVL